MTWFSHVLEWGGAVAGVGWFATIPMFLFRHQRELSGVATQVDNLVTNVASLVKEYESETKK